MCGAAAFRHFGRNKANIGDRETCAEEDGEEDRDEDKEKPEKQIEKKTHKKA